MSIVLASKGHDDTVTLLLNSGAYVHHIWRYDVPFAIGAIGKVPLVMELFSYFESAGPLTYGEFQLMEADELNAVPIFIYASEQHILCKFGSRKITITPSSHTEACLGAYTKEGKLNTGGCFMSFGEKGIWKPVEDTKSLWRQAIAFPGNISDPTKNICCSPKEFDYNMYDLMAAIEDAQGVDRGNYHEITISPSARTEMGLMSVMSTIDIRPMRSCDEESVSFLSESVPVTAVRCGIA